MTHLKTPTRAALGAAVAAAALATAFPVFAGPIRPEDDGALFRLRHGVQMNAALDARTSAVVFRPASAENEFTLDDDAYVEDLAALRRADLAVALPPPAPLPEPPRRLPPQTLYAQAAPMLAYAAPSAPVTAPAWLETSSTTTETLAPAPIYAAAESYGEIVPVAASAPAIYDAPAAAAYAPAPVAASPCAGGVPGGLTAASLAPGGAFGPQTSGASGVSQTFVNGELVAASGAASVAGAGFGGCAEGVGGPVVIVHEVTTSPVAYAASAMESAALGLSYGAAGGYGMSSGAAGWGGGGIAVGGGAASAGGGGGSFAISAPSVIVGGGGGGGGRTVIVEGSTTHIDKSTTNIDRSTTQIDKSTTNIDRRSFDNRSYDNRRIGD